MLDCADILPTLNISKMTNSNDITLMTNSVGYWTMWRLNALLSASSNKPSCWLNFTAPKKESEIKLGLTKTESRKERKTDKERAMLLTQMTGLWGAVLGNSNTSSFLLVLSLKSVLKSVLNVLHCSLSVLRGVRAHAQLNAPDRAVDKPISVC